MLFLQQTMSIDRNLKAFDRIAQIASPLSDCFAQLVISAYIKSFISCFVCINTLHNIAMKFDLMLNVCPNYRNTPLVHLFTMLFKVVRLIYYIFIKLLQNTKKKMYFHPTT